MSSSPPDLIFLLPLGLSTLALLMGLKAGKRRRLLDDTPTCKTLGVFIGEVEVEGVCVTTNPIHALFCQQPCVIYDWEIHEEWERWVTVAYTDDKGHRRTRRELRRGWEMVAGKTYWQGFYLKDDYGYVWVHPAGAQLDRQLLFDEYTERGTALYAMGPRAEISDSTGRRRFKETGLAVDTSLFVRGRASERPDIVAPQIVQDERAEMFLISTRSEKAISQGKATAYFVWHVLGLMAGIFSGLAFGLGKASSTGDNVPLYALCGGLIYGLAWLIGWIWMVFNSLIGLRNRVRQAQSLIDVQVKRRADLIPPLTACLQGLRQHESEVQVAVTQLRSQAGLLSGITAVSSTVIAVAEQYPVLMANQSFQSLSKNIKETEDRIALARNYANDITTFYNTRLTRIPDCYVAQLVQMTPEPLFMAKGFEQKVIPVGF